MPISTHASARVFVDTNVLVYLLDDSEATKQTMAREKLKAEAEQAELVISTQVLQELYSALTRGAHPIRMPEDAERAVRDAARFSTVQIDPPLIFAGIARSRRDRIAFWDGLVIEAALLAGCERILSEDLQDGRSFGTLRVENPFPGRSRSVR